MNEGNRVSRVVSMFLSLLLALNCLGMTGLAFATDAGSEQPTPVPDSQERSGGSESGDGQDTAGTDAREAGRNRQGSSDDGVKPAETGGSSYGSATGDVSSSPSGSGASAEQPAEAQDTEETVWNAAPILGSATRDGVTVEVSAPVGCFPEGTTVTIDAIPAEENKIGFDITFEDGSGNEVQPANGLEVSVRFSIDTGSTLLPEDGSATKISAYHKDDDGTVELLKSVAADDGPARIEVAASRFSEYGVLSETTPSSGEEVSSDEARGADRAEPMATRSATSTNLADFLTDVTIDAPTDENGNYIVDPNSTYEITMKFAENEGTQFDDDAVLTYDFPDGLIVSDFGATTFSIEVKDSNGTATVEGNTFEVVDGQLRVRFNQSDPNFDRLKAAANANFEITIASSFDQTVGEIVFNAIVVKDFVFEERSDLTIDKSVVYDFDSDTAHYTLKVTSYGTNENVVIEDHLTGTALVFNKDVSAQSSVNGTLSITPDYDSVANGYTVTIPQMTDKEVVTLTYSAAVDNTKITGNGTVEQTNNTARVTSVQVPDGKEANADFAGQVTFDRIDKTAAGDPVDLGNGQYEQTWTITVNADHKMVVGGTTIYDWIATNSRPFMTFTGDGITVDVTFEDGTTEKRAVAWSDLTLYPNGDGTYNGWAYLTPESDGKASYVITCKTLIDTEGALGDLTLVNGAQIYDSYDEGTTKIEGIGESDFDIEKNAVGTTSTESEWAVTVTVPGSGLSDLRVTDDAPKLVHEGQDYIDTFIEGSFSVDGLLEGESWKLYVGTSGRSYTLTFYKTGEQTDANKGVLPTSDGQPRDITIRFKTAVNQDWLNLAADNGYASSSLYVHRNYAAAWSGSYRTQTVSDYVIPIKPNLVKNFIERSDVEVDGVTYPVFRYSLSLYGPVEDGIVIHDAFNTDYLKLYEAEGVKILGGNSTTPTDGNGTVSATATTDGMDITVSSFPKQGDGSFYPYYQVDYALIVKDQAALEALNGAAAQSQGGIDLENTATWDDLTSSRTVNYTYFPYVDKELLTRPTADNGYVAEFKVIINKYAEDLDPTSDTLTIQDELSSNLRFIPDSLTISPANDSIGVQHDSETNTLTFTDVPDNTAYEITYQARVLGTGNVTYSNTIKFGKFEKTIDEETTVSSSGGGSASNPSITLVKRDSENLSTTLAGATFQLFYMDNSGNQVPVQDSNGQDVTFTTGDDGTVLIVGNQQSLGWTLWTGRTYRLVEMAAPTGYDPNTEPTDFVLSETPSSQMEFDITGDQLNIQDEPIKISIPVTKTWVGPIEADTVTVHLMADGNDSGETVSLSEANGWTGSFDNLRKYDVSDGHEIVYEVTEDPLAGYATEITGSAAEGYLVTNTNTQTVEVAGSKTWDDADDQNGRRPESITVRLLADGVEVQDMVVTAEDGWSWSFPDLLKYDAVDGHEIAYSVTEDAVSDYSTTYSDDGYDVTNTYTPDKTSVTVIKVWADAFDRDGIRPDSVTVRLLADGSDTGLTMVLSEGNNWIASFAGLDEYQDGQKVVYTVSEDAVSGYTTTVMGDAEMGYVVMNSHDPKATPPGPKKPASMLKSFIPKTGDSIWPCVTALAALVAGGLMLVRYATGRK